MAFAANETANHLHLPFAAILLFSPITTQTTMRRSFSPSSSAEEAELLLIRTKIKKMNDCSVVHLLFRKNGKQFNAKAQCSLIP